MFIYGGGCGGFWGCCWKGWRTPPRIEVTHNVTDEDCCLPPGEHI